MATLEPILAGVALLLSGGGLVAWYLAPAQKRKTLAEASKILDEVNGEMIERALLICGALEGENARLRDILKQCRARLAACEERAANELEGKG